MRKYVDGKSVNSSGGAIDSFIPFGRSWDFKNTEFIVKPENFSYIQPTYSLSDESLVSKSPYLIVAAPGAVGKSAFGLHLARTKNAMLWNLAKLRLGSNTFSGSLLEAVGLEGLREFVSLIEKGEITLVFDAIDEAELHSGWMGVQDFLRDVIRNTKNAKPASVIFLARRDSAELLELALEDLLSPLQTYSTASIGFFSRPKAADFVLAQVDKLKGSDFVRKNDLVLRQKIQEAFAMPVAGESGAEESFDWRSAEHERFFGYAPVLQTIAKLLVESENIYTISLNNGKSGYAEIVAEILGMILDRETTKFSEAAAQRLGSEQDSDVREIYSRFGQQEKLLGLLNSDDSEAYALPPTVKPQIATQLDEMLRSFLPQHPFLDGKNFAGPAFRDYVLANGLTSDECRFASEIWIESNRPLFTPILASLYHTAGSARAFAEDAELLYESANAGAVSGQSSLLLFVSESDPDDLTIEIAGDDSGPLGERLHFSAKNPTEISFKRRLTNAQIVTSAVVSLGRKDQLFEIVDSEVVAERIRFESDHVRVRSEGVGVSRLESNKSIQTPPIFKVDALNSDLLSVVAPNSKVYPWNPYYSESIGQQERVDADTTLHVMARILGWFRKDRRKEYGRYKDLIVKHVVGSSLTARYALGFIQNIGALSEDKNLYFIDTDILDSYEISWQKIRRSTVSEKAKQSVEQYLRATPEPPTF